MDAIRTWVDILQDLPGAVTAEELARYLDLKELDERLYLFEAVSAYDGYVDWSENLFYMHQLGVSLEMLLEGFWCRWRSSEAQFPCGHSCICHTFVQVMLPAGPPHHVVHLLKKWDCSHIQAGIANMLIVDHHRAFFHIFSSRTLLFVHEAQLMSRPAWIWAMWSGWGPHLWHGYSIYLQGSQEWKELFTLWHHRWVPHPHQHCHWYQCKRFFLINARLGFAGGGLKLRWIG